MTRDPESLSDLLRRSLEFESLLESFFPEPFVLANSQQKVLLAATACSLSLEHAYMARAAFAASAPNSAASLLRLQFEALVRAAWGLFAATDAELAKLSAALDISAEHTAKNSPGVVEMLKDVGKTAPPGLAVPLQEFHDNSRHALNSFVHTGIHALRRAQEGFPVPLAMQLVQMSNGLLHFAYRMLASLTGSQARMDAVTRAYAEFADCLPLVTVRTKTRASSPGGTHR